MITVFADQHLYKIDEIIPDEIDLRLYNPEEGLPGDLDQANALLIRTVTTIDRHTLDPVPENLQFIGTGSAGTDHVDTNFLKEHGIRFAHSAGCNARSVTEYVTTALIIWSESKNVDLKNETIGIVGVGHVGSALREMLDQLKWPYKLYDPPRAERESAFTSTSLPELLDCSILTFHTPLNTEGQHATYHWLNSNKLSNRHYKLVINTSRGGVIDEEALLRAEQTNTVEDSIIDVWENEPAFRDEVARRAYIATPHIAGYSVQAKFRATKMIVDQMIDHFALDLPLPPLTKGKEQIAFPDLKYAVNSTVSEIFKTVHPICDYYDELKKLIGLPKKEKQFKFRKLRTSFPYRNEFAFLGIPKSILKKNIVPKELFQS